MGAAELRAALFGEGARNLIASLSTPHAEYAPSYIQNHAYVTLTVTVARPLHPQSLHSQPRQPETPEVEEDVGLCTVEVQPRYECYGRLVMIMRHCMSSLAQNLISVVQESNCVAMSIDKSHPYELATVVLTEQQKSDPNLDILTGFVLIDRRARIMVIEGLRDGNAWPKLLDTAGVGKERNTKKCK